MVEDSYRHRGMRNSLVKIIKEKGIRDPRILEAVRKIPRHFFFDQAFLEHAYQDKAFPIGHGQTISQNQRLRFPFSGRGRTYQGNQEKEDENF